ncbi:hypothetical protein E2C01_078503 [Portunus trituberculatus]|uniref:Uncharacterized protein n=1 Tax=Portunus trituberculatus TaxID=210409 RepID=A0A5B7IQD9_PORTR|nr:hypothetical protein [Portunus trituberculatus]
MARLKPFIARVFILARYEWRITYVDFTITSYDKKVKIIHSHLNHYLYNLIVNPFSTGTHFFHEF